MNDGVWYFIVSLLGALFLGVAANVVYHRDEIKSYIIVRWDYVEWRRQVLCLQFKQWRSVHKRTPREKLLDSIGR